jgi:hypothetical protein
MNAMHRTLTSGLAWPCAQGTVYVSEGPGSEPVTLKASSGESGPVLQSASKGLDGARDDCYVCRTRLDAQSLDEPA